MSNRKTYDEELETLNRAISDMGHAAGEAIREACLLLAQPDEATAQRVIEGDKNIDRAEQEIEHRCLELLLRQQPVAADLRRVSTALKLVTDIERIGDHAADIAEITLMLAPGWQGLIPIETDLEKMSAAAQDMVQHSIEAFLTEDMVAAQEVIDMDDIVDGLFDAVKTELAAYIAKHPQQVDAALDLLMVTKYLERLGDHAVNIAEWVRFLKTGAYRGCHIV